MHQERTRNQVHVIRASSASAAMWPNMIHGELSMFRPNAVGAHLLRLELGEHPDALAEEPAQELPARSICLSYGRPPHISLADPQVPLGEQ